MQSSGSCRPGDGDHGKGEGRRCMVVFEGLLKVSMATVCSCSRRPRPYQSERLEYSELQRKGRKSSEGDETVRDGARGRERLRDGRRPDGFRDRLFVQAFVRFGEGVPRAVRVSDVTGETG